MSKVTYKGPLSPGALITDPTGANPSVFCPKDGTVDVPLSWLGSLLSSSDWIAADSEAETYVPPAEEFFDEVYVSQSDGRLVDEQRDDIFDPSSVARRAQSATAATYNGDGTVATYTVDGVTTTYTYNGDGTVATASTPQGSQTRVETFSYTAGVYTGSTVVIS